MKNLADLVDLADMCPTMGNEGWWGVIKGVDGCWGVMRVCSWNAFVSCVLHSLILPSLFMFWVPIYKLFFHSTFHVPVFKILLCVSFLCSSAENVFHIPNTYGTWSGHWFWLKAFFPYNTTTAPTLDHQLLCRRSHDLTSPLFTPLKEVNGSVLLPFTHYPLLTPISLTYRIEMPTIINVIQ